MAEIQNIKYWLPSFLISFVTYFLVDVYLAKEWRHSLIEAFIFAVFYQLFWIAQDRLSEKKKRK